jgi:hypothetical protein
LSKDDRQKRQAALDAIVKTSMDAVVADWPKGCPSLHAHFHYGVIGISPQYLVAWYIFKTNADLDLAKQKRWTLEVDRRTRKELAAHRYPIEFVNRIGVSFTTDEDVRNSGMNGYQYFNTNSPVWFSEPKPD